MPFTNSYHKSRFEKAGKPLGDEHYYCGILEGVSADQDFLRELFGLTRHAARQQCCPYCPIIQWVNAREAPVNFNDPSLLYTVYGPQEATRPSFGLRLFQRFVVRRLASRDEWTSWHGDSPLTTVAGWDPSRHLTSPSRMVNTSKESSRTTCMSCTWDAPQTS